MKKKCTLPCDFHLSPKYHTPTLPGIKGSLHHFLDGWLDPVCAGVLWGCSNKPAWHELQPPGVQRHWCPCQACLYMPLTGSSKNCLSRGLGTWPPSDTEVWGSQTWTLSIWPWLGHHALQDEALGLKQQWKSWGRLHCLIQRNDDGSVHAEV